MFKNPIKKYQSGGPVTQEQAEDQIVSVIALQLSGGDQQKAKSLLGPVKQRLQEIKSNEQESQILKAGLQKLQNNDESGMQDILSLFANAPQKAKLGAKLRAFICKHANGKKIADCGCGNKVPKGEMGVVIRPTSYNRANGLQFVERQYTPDGQAVYTMATSRETLPSNMLADPYSEYSQNGGEYQGNGQVQIIDNGKGNLRVLGNPYGPTDEGLQHGQDSVNYVNRLRELAKKANIKLGPSFQENGGVVKAQDGNSNIELPSDTTKVKYSYSKALPFGKNNENLDSETINYSGGYLSMPIKRNGTFVYHGPNYIGLPDRYMLPGASKGNFFIRPWARANYPIDSTTYNKVDSTLVANRPQNQKNGGKTPNWINKKKNK